MRDDQQELDARLERLALGQLTDTERAELEAKAKSDPALAQALELHAPLSADLRARLVEVVRGPQAEVVPLPLHPPQRPAGSLRRMVPLAGVLATAAAIAIAFVSIDRSPPLPSYVLRARAGDAEWRGEAPRSRTLRSDSTIELILQPAHPAEGPIEARLFIVQGATFEVAAHQPQISKDGAVRWLARADEIAPGKLGKLTLIAVVGKAGTLPASAEEVRGPTNDWQSMPVEVEILAAGAAP